ncbi:MAG TPA: hypothetical protein VJ732_15385 [Bryobacteraceae bacterium]|nr:hypothetical protein [Bryobacteraceae bacterium]
MDLSKVLAQLRQELADLDSAILSLERLQEGGRRRGRPPGRTAKGKDTGSRAGAEGAPGPRGKRES